MDERDGRVAVHASFVAALLEDILGRRGVCEQYQEGGERGESYGLVEKPV